MSRSLHLCLALAVGAAATLGEPAAGLDENTSGGDGTLFVGTYRRSVYVIDEADFQIRKEIDLPIAMPIDLALSIDRSRLYARDADLERWAVIDVASREVVDEFTLSQGHERVLTWGYAFDPSGRYAVFVLKRITQLRDRFEIAEPKLVRYDLESKQLTQEIPWPDDTPREFAEILFSPDGKNLFLLADDIIVIDAETLEESDRWQYSRALQEGMGRFNFQFPGSLYDEPGTYTGLFRVTDPVQNRQMMGVAEVDLANRDVDFFMLGPSERVSFALAPDRKKAYGLHQEVGNYELWTFDLEGRRVESKLEFDGRPRMSLMPSSNGKLLYIYGAGNTFDIYEAATFRFLRTVELDADMSPVVMIPPATPGG